MSPRILSLSTAAVCLCACARGGPAPSATIRPTEMKSVQQIAEAVSAHDRRCAMPAAPPQPSHIAADLGMTDCNTEVDDAELGRCLREIEEQPCDAPAASRFERIPTCRLGAVCRTTDEGTL